MAQKSNQNTIHYIVHVLLVLIIIGLIVCLVILKTRKDKKSVECPEPSVKTGNLIVKVPGTALEMKVSRDGDNIIYTTDYYTDVNNIVIDYSKSTTPEIKDNETGDYLVLDKTGNENKFIFKSGELSPQQYKSKISTVPGTQGIIVYAVDSENRKYSLNVEQFDPYKVKCPMVLRSETTRNKKLHNFVVL